MAPTTTYYVTELLNSGGEADAIKHAVNHLSLKYRNDSYCV